MWGWIVAAAALAVGACVVYWASWVVEEVENDWERLVYDSEIDTTGQRRSDAIPHRKT